MVANRLSAKKMKTATKKLYQGLGWPTLFTQIRFFTAPYQRLEELVPKKGLVIDLGCGYGIFANYLGLTGPQREVLGMDLDANKLKFADRGVKNTRFLRQDITQAKLKKARVIVLIHVLHHLSSFQEQEKLLIELKKKLTKDGELIIAEVDRKPVIKYWLGCLADKIMYPGDKIYYRFPQEFERLFKKLGFQVKTTRPHRGKPFAHVIYLLSYSPNR